MKSGTQKSKLIQILTSMNFDMKDIQGKNSRLEVPSMWLHEWGKGRKEEIIFQAQKEKKSTSNTTLGDIPKRLLLQRHLHIHVYGGTIHNSQVMETAKMPHH
jgi:hypothetical protein